MSTEPLLLEMRDIRIDGFSDERWHKIVKGVDLTLAPGEVLGLIGESGAGKSTLGLAAMGFARPGCRISGGQIIFDGLDLMKLGEQQKRALWGNRIAYVAQSAAAAFNPAHRLLDQTVESRTMHGKDLGGDAREDARTLYASLQLPDPDHIGNRYPHQVSGGQLQRMMTAMAMSPRPDLIIFDEPTTALDVTTQVEVLVEIRKIVREFNTAAIYITHDLAVVAQMADRIKVLRYGEEVEEAAVRTMLVEPRASYTKSLWSVRALQKQESPGEDDVLELVGISASYNQTIPVLHQVTVHAPRGRTLAIVGESGSGKSTLARVITGLLPRSEGSITFDGETLPPTLAQRSLEHKRRIQMIYQMADTAMNPRHSVGQIIARPLEFYFGLKGSERDRQAIELLKMIELDESFFDRVPAELSGGQKQRICIARALAAKPDLVICDEVTSALDQIVQEGILKLLMRLQQEFGVTYLFITHDIAT
ncbi:MAG: ABC transporter ATP-binding protein, partial [Pseudomonadota bacterium]